MPKNNCLTLDDDNHTSPLTHQHTLPGMDESVEPNTIQKKLNADAVNQPAHYMTGEIEVIDYIRDKLTKEEFVGYCNGNVMKYVSRWRSKGGTDDLRKAAVYQRWGIERQEKD